MKEILLGRKIDYRDIYSPEILTPIDRLTNRKIYNIEDANDLFCGFDAWHIYEANFLLNNGLPVSGIIKIVYPSTSEFIIESKSLKLYIGSLGMTKMGVAKQEAILSYVNTIRNDLSLCLNCKEVEVRFFEPNYKISEFDFKDYKLLENEDLSQITFTDYNENYSILKENIGKANKLKMYTNLLKSNCKITNQPDHGSIYIHIKADKTPSPISILKYIVSIRNENHFHEEICEMVYKRLWDIFSPEELSVSCLYTRRGGIDICPCRSNKPNLLPSNLANCNKLSSRTFHQ